MIVNPIIMIMITLLLLIFGKFKFLKKYSDYIYSQMLQNMMYIQIKNFLNKKVKCQVIDPND
jgi:hypothetical protein